MNMNGALAARLMVGALALSCGDGGGATSSEFVSSYCDLLQPCCAMAKLSTDGKQCKALLGAFAPTNYNATAGEACLAELRAASGKPDFCSDGLDGTTGSCDKAFPDQSSGSKKPGETCDMDDECAPSAEGDVRCQRASVVGGTVVRKCQVHVIGKEGDQPCVGTVDGSVTSYSSSGDDVPPKGYLCRVADGLYCDWTSHACVKFKAIGESCSGSSDCGRGGSCDGGKCVARKELGAACTGGFASQGECVEGAYCSATSMTCAAQLGDGMACTDQEACKSQDCVNGKCKGDVPANFALGLLCGGL
jgi:hypothetical protein